jgi:hypothetical protein
MSTTFERVCDLAAQRAVRISEHGYDELAQDGLLAGDVVYGVKHGQVIED